MDVPRTTNAADWTCGIGLIASALVNEWSPQQIPRWIQESIGTSSPTGAKTETGTRSGMTIRATSVQQIFRNVDYH